MVQLLTLEEKNAHAGRLRAALRCTLLVRCRVHAELQVCTNLQRISPRIELVKARIRNMRNFRVPLIQRRTVDFGTNQERTIYIDCGVYLYTFITLFCSCRNTLHKGEVASALVLYCRMLCWVEGGGGVTWQPRWHLGDAFLGSQAANSSLLPDYPPFQPPPTLKPGIWREKPCATTRPK